MAAAAVFVLLLSACAPPGYSSSTPTPSLPERRIVYEITLLDGTKKEVVYKLCRAQGNGSGSLVVSCYDNVWEDADYVTVALDLKVEKRP